MKHSTQPKLSAASRNGTASTNVETTDDITLTIGTIPKSTITGKHDAGSDANETVDGLNEIEELTRHIIEDVPSGGGDDVEDIPVFDRGDTLTRV